MSDLKPCPFCGGEAKLMHMDLDSIEEGWQVWGVWCMDDMHAEDSGGYQHGHFIDNFATAAEAIVAWNTRTHGTLTAEQVMAIAGKHQPDYCSDTHVCFDWQAVADELNELGSGTCEPNWVLQGQTQTQEFWRCECGNCGECFGVETRESFPFKVTIDKVDVPNFCPNCGKAVKR